MKNFNLRYKLLVLSIFALFVWAIAADLPFSFKAGEVISAEQMNQNFTTLNTSKQELVKGTCAAGSSIRAIAADGTVTCEVDDIGSGAGDAGVDAINGQTGAVTLQAGTNITIDDSTAGQIKISASGDGSSYTADNTSLALNGSTFSIKDEGVTAKKLAFPLERSGNVNGSMFSVINTSAGEQSVAVRGSAGALVPLLNLPAGTSVGVLGNGEDYGVYGSGSRRGVSGESSSGTGVYGESSNGTGVQGFSSNSTGLFGTSNTGIGIFGRSFSRGIVGIQGSAAVSCLGTYAVGGCAEDTGTGIFGASNAGIGVLGKTSGVGSSGVRGETVGDILGYGVSGFSKKSIGVFGESTDSTGTAIYGKSTSGRSALFLGGAGGSGNCFYDGGAGWNCTSDKNAKENFQNVNSLDVLNAVATMPVSRWNMKGDLNQTPHMGPVSQDFYAAFGLGGSDITINTADAQGVALAAIQGLYQLVQEQQAKIDMLEAKLDAK